ncbi:MAG: ParB/RepB/Spo0J family partition protein [Candidatus Paceibacteria bacterium]
MAMCFVIGSIESAGETAKLLRKRGIPVKAFEPTSDNKGILEACRIDEQLAVVAVFLRSIKKDVPAFFRSLRDNLAPGVGIHILTQGAQLSDYSRKIANEVTTPLTLEPFHADRVISSRWFLNFKRDETKNYEERTGGTVVRKSVGATPTPAIANTESPKAAREPVGATPTRAEAVTSTQPQSATSRVRLQDLESYKASIARGNTAVAVVAPKSIGATPVPEKVVTPTLSATPTARAAPSVSEEKEDDNGVLEDLLKVIQKNHPLQKEQTVVNIVGKAGTSQHLDPRRVRPLSGQPRYGDSNGFTSESLTELAEAIKTFGQLEDASVCPIVGDPLYDAQLIDGERRHDACLYAGVMMKATVREDVTADMRLQLYLLSVVRNFGKEPHSTIEYVGMVRTFLGPDYKMPRSEVGKILGKSYSQIIKYEQLGTLHPEVLAKVGESHSRKSKGAKADAGKAERKLTAHLASLLVDVPSAEQLSKAEEIISGNMSFIEARRYLLGVRREMHIKYNPRQGRNSKTFQSITTLSKTSINAFGVFGDMTEAEMLAVMSTRDGEERHAVVNDLQVLAENIRSLANRIALVEG